MTPEEEAAFHEELAAIEESLEHTLELAQLMLGMRLVDDGHAPNLGAGIRLAKDLDKVRELYPEPAD